ncbi:phosphotransferase [Streptomyces sp. NPDC050439]|uniref:phosphotransferase n=1 Tax=Streptomyces sp. NPDC050439 TaxID=3155517 RepID=UPI003437BA3F
MAQKAATNVIQSTVAGLDQHIEQEDDLLSAAEAATLHRLLSALPELGILPSGWRHGDFWERNLLWNGRRCALIDFERSDVCPLGDHGVQDGAEGDDHQGHERGDHGGLHDGGAVRAPGAIAIPAAHVIRPQCLTGEDTGVRGASPGS